MMMTTMNSAGDFFFDEAFLEAFGTSTSDRTTDERWSRGQQQQEGCSLITDILNEIPIQDCFSPDAIVPINNVSAESEVDNVSPTSSSSVNVVIDPHLSSPDNDSTIGSGKCPVCEDGQLGKHLHYGGKACHSCRGFFRRSVQNNHYPLFECLTGENQCSILSKSRRSCKKCRFRRCLDLAGLQISLVMTVDQRRQRLLSRFSKTKLNGGSGDGFTIMKRMRLRELSLQFSDDETAVLQNMFLTLLDCNHVKYYDLFLKCPCKMQLFLDSVVQGRPLKKCLLETMNKIDETSTKNFAFEVREMFELTPSDRMALVSSNVSMIHGIEWAWFTSILGFPCYYKTLVDYGERNKDIKPQFQPILEHLKSVNGQPSPDKWNIALIYGTHEMSSEHERAWTRLINWMSSVDGNSFDFVLNILLAMVMLFSKDDVSCYGDGDTCSFNEMDLEHPERVQHIQQRYLHTLHRYLKARYPSEATERFNEGLRLLCEARHFYDIHRQRLEKVANEPKIQNSYEYTNNNWSLM